LDKSASQDLGEFVWGGFFSRKHFALRPGSIYIGRKDEDERSDLQLTDKYVSRRSVKLDVIPSDKGYLFKMTVEHASNPVYVNSTEVAVNNSIYLNYDDVITLGKTKLVFKKK
jgi:pSer/pThr/pTyr-binding forkhead associated (FHA) protein